MWPGGSTSKRECLWEWEIDTVLKALCAVTGALLELAGIAVFFLAIIALVELGNLFCGG